MCSCFHVFMGENTIKMSKNIKLTIKKPVKIENNIEKMSKKIQNRIALLFMLLYNEANTENKA